jgi:sec-independent protein translocase protein TatA
VITGIGAALDQPSAPDWSGEIAMFGSLGPMEMVLIMGLGVLLFGKRLPEVGRSLGRGIVEFKKGLNGVGDDFDSSSSSRSSSSYGSSRHSDDRPAGDSTYADSGVPKFELPGTASGSPATPTADSASVPQMEYPSPTPRD